MSKPKKSKSSWLPFAEWKVKLQQEGVWQERSGGRKGATRSKGGGSSKSVKPPIKVEAVYTCPHCGGAIRVGEA